ncbi:Starch-binding associating with outer membrane [Mariniphaga anaerophila]|uniref:Starch-binding associating with outer membrane n=1 Tax=Mariniphaga anaerophila TaxID=1484053 RepID=A0A1M5BX60_9BACT|nr:RagB/SusD family nutrient uptake outer membrane protein [Mariniphaga anaerophila]SHF46822.1 Starch-binding associating with outer membrane [Mariniphaga anaerophila]
MKNISIKIFVLAGVLAFASCDDYLDAPAKSTLDEQTIFSNATFAEQAIAGVIQSFCETNSYRGRFIAYYGINTDLEIRKSLSGSTSDAAQTLANYYTTPTNGNMDAANNAWAKFYEGIERANLAIRGLRTYGDVENRPEMAQLLGEMLTLRAVVYNDLLRGWGNVPARFEPINSETVNLPKVDRDEILKQLLADLEEAGNYCAWPNEIGVTTSSERINKAFAKGLRARLALAAAGYSQHLASSPNGSSQLTLSNDPDLAPEKMYQIVKDECLDIINSGTCRLLDFEECFKDFCSETYVAGGEVLWSIPFSSTRGRVLFDLGLTHTTEDKYVKLHANKGGSTLIMPTLWYDYEKEDARRSVTACPFVWTDGKQVPSSAQSWCIGKYRYEWLSQARWRNESSNDDGLNYLYMRYSDVLLMAAEAINELEGPGAAAPYFREVRNRAYPENPEMVDAYMNSISGSKDAFFKAIVKERGLEFAGEMLRKGDLIRWNMLGSAMDEAGSKLQAWDNRQDYTSQFDGTVYPYSQLPDRIYYKTALDGESIVIHGLNYGDPDAAPDASYSGTKEWSLNDVPLWDYIALRNPNLQPYWPVWQNFINTSEGALNNDDYNMP